MSKRALPSNQDLLSISIAHPEPVLDPAYFKDPGLLISANPLHPNRLMKDNSRVNDLITAWRMNRELGHTNAADAVLDELVGHLSRSPKINLGEFAGFWATQDVSFSFFKSLPMDARKVFVAAALVEYLNRRHEIYCAHGLSATTLQVRADVAAHKQSGSLARHKVSGILIGESYRHATTVPSNGEFICADSKSDKKAYEELAKIRGLKSAFGKGVKKYPDFAFMHAGHLFIVEHKHKQEGGGGQSAAIQELANFINRHEVGDANAHYIAFMDGYLFNRIFANPDASLDPQSRDQRETVKRILGQKAGNYFVNTAGFRALLKELAPVQ